MYTTLKRTVLTALTAAAIGGFAGVSHAANIIAYGGDLKYIEVSESIDVGMNRMEDDEQGFFFREKAVEVDNLVVNGKYSDGDVRINEVDVVSGLFDSFFFHFDPLGKERRVRKFRGWVEFDRNIEGYIGQVDLLRKTHRQLGLKQVRYWGSGGLNRDDNLRLTVRGNRVEFRLNVSMAADSFRLLIGQKEARNYAAEEGAQTIEVQLATIEDRKNVNTAWKDAEKQ